MEWDIYGLDKNEDGLGYTFYSEGPKRRIRKVIKFQHLTYPGGNVYNLAFGDFDELTGNMDDGTISNNGDRLKVLHTVASAVIEFLSIKSSAIILITGSTSSRTRLYQIRIAGFLSQVTQQFEILGELGKEWLPFRVGVNYKRFLVFKK
jgi:hypothetical protein